MRPQLPVIRYLVLLLALVFSTGTVAADSRSDAKAHYQAGVKLYTGGDYKGAIREFSSAQQLLPADLNNYNLALCYDKLGDPEPAIQYYRAFLDKQPGTDKRTEIEASIARLEAASRSAAAKKAAEAAKAEDARKAAEAKQAAEDARLAEEARKAEEARLPEDRKPADEDPRTGIGTTGTPGGAGGTVSTGDAQLDRVSGIDINQIRDQRLGGAASGMPDTRGGPATTNPNDVAGGNAAANIDVNAHAGTAGAATAPPANPNDTAAAQQPAGNPDPSDKPKAKPVYKKWWFWAVVAVSAYVVYSIATENSSSSNNTGRMLLPTMANSNSAASGAGGMTLMRW